MGAVFVSYRRGDSEGQARALSFSLVKQLGNDAVFMDVDSIALGRDFRQVLHERLASCDAMMVLIGPDWLDARGPSGRRLDSPTDYVRQEIAAALKRNIPVIPVLVQGASMPAAESLPEDIRDLVYRNGFELGHTTWESDVREMVTRLGLTAAPTGRSEPIVAPGAPPAGIASLDTGEVREVSPPPAPGLTPVWRRPAAAAAAVVLVVVIVGIYLASRPPSSGASAGVEEGGGVRVETTPLPARNDSGSNGASPSTGASNAGNQPASVNAALGANQFAFDWPGDDCWDVFRGEQFVAYQCGAKQQTLGLGRYTIKPKHAPVFLPFEVELKSGASTRIGFGGVLEFKWAGDDCWDIMRGEELVTYQCGAKKQTLGAGRYTIKAKHAPLFAPFPVEVKDGSSTRVELGGLFTFKWPGDDCWDIFRGAELVTYQCGAKTQALGAGTYTIKGKHGPVFEPFNIKIVDGATVQAP
jgi:hypothetical protein